jgi:predicted amidohydrolase YtcJ
MQRLTLLRGGTVRTLDPARPQAGAVAVAGARIDALDAYEGEPVDLRGRCVVPGFTDSHVHFPSWALLRRQVDLRGTRSAAEAAALAASAAPSGDWVVGRGWRDTAWAQPPHRRALDAIDAPVALIAHDGHSLWLNGAALARAGGDLRTPGGIVEVDDDGEPTGILRETAAWRFRDEHLQPTAAERLEAVRAALAAAHAAGVVAIHDKDGGAGAPEAFAALRAEGALTLRVRQSIPAARIADDVEADYVKAFMDGTLGSGTARMLGGGGTEITSRAGLEEIVRVAAARGLPVAVHAIGDAAARDALDGFEATAEAWRPLGLRQRIEHCQFVDPADQPRFAALGVTASVQFAFATSDRDAADARGLGERPGAYPFASLLRAGAVVVSGSDAPVEPLDPLAGIRAGVLRTADRRPPWHAEEALTVEQALVATCRAPAWVAGEERERGRLAPGLLADLVVLSADPFVAPLHEVAVVATMVGGRWVHGAPPWD